MKRLAYSIVMLGLATRLAAAGNDLVIVGPAAGPGVPAAALGDAKALLGKSGIALSTKPIDTTCAADTTCITTTGGQLGAHRVVAVAMAMKGASFGVSLLLVDIDGKELIAKRELTLNAKTLAKQLVPAVKKLVDNGPNERAKELFDQGSKNYNLGEYAQALELYKRAYRIKALPAFLFNIAQCHRKLGQHKDAIQMYQSYLTGVPDADNRKVVEGLIAESQAAYADQQKRADERARLDTEKKKAEEARRGKEAEAAAAAEKRRIEAEKTEGMRVARQRDLDRTYNRHPARKWIVVTGILGGGAVIAGGVFGYLARDVQQDFDARQCGDRTVPRPQPELDACNADITKGEKDIRLRNYIGGAGAAVLLGSVIVFAIDPGNLERPNQTRAQLRLVPGGAQVVVRW